MPATDLDRGEGYKAPAATNTPEALVSTSTLCTAVEIVAVRSNRTANTSSMWLGYTATNDSQRKELAPGATWTLESNEGEQLDLATIYVDSVTVGDGVIFTYLN